MLCACSAHKAYHVGCVRIGPVRMIIDTHADGGSLPFFKGRPGQVNEAQHIEEDEQHIASPRLALVLVAHLRRNEAVTAGRFTAQ